VDAEFVHVAITTPVRSMWREEVLTMRVWIDQDCCTGAGLCVDHCPELFIVLDDGIGYVRDGMTVMTDPNDPSVAVPRRYEQAAIDAVERCPGECIFLESDGSTRPSAAQAAEPDIVDAEIVRG
jgi:ferredoxin